MTQQVDKFFGIHLSIDTEINKDKYTEIKKQISKQIKQVTDIDAENVEVYIYKLNLEIKTKHLGVTPLEARLAKLDVKLELNQEAKRSKRIRFLNGQLDLVKYDPDVTVKHNKNCLSYSLTGKYCREYSGYSDYIATLVNKGCPKKHKVLTVKATAYATDRFKKRVVNFGGSGGSGGGVTTKLQFPLTRDIQIKLDL